MSSLITSHRPSNSFTMAFHERFVRRCKLPALDPSLVFVKISPHLLDRTFNSSILFLRRNFRHLAFQSRLKNLFPGEKEISLSFSTIHFRRKELNNPAQSRFLLRSRFEIAPPHANEQNQRGSTWRRKRKGEKKKKKWIRSGARIVRAERKYSSNGQKPGIDMSIERSVANLM